MQESKRCVLPHLERRGFDFNDNGQLSSDEVRAALLQLYGNCTYLVKDPASSNSSATTYCKVSGQGQFLPGGTTLTRTCGIAGGELPLLALGRGGAAWRHEVSKEVYTTHQACCSWVGPDHAAGNPLNWRTNNSNLAGNTLNASTIATYGGLIPRECR